jgi:hypothetical protein
MFNHELQWLHPRCVVVGFCGCGMVILHAKSNSMPRSSSSWQASISSRNFQRLKPCKDSQALRIDEPFENPNLQLAQRIFSWVNHATPQKAMAFIKKLSSFMLCVAEYDRCSFAVKQLAPDHFKRKQ